MSGWPSASFSDVITDETGGNKKVLQSDLLLAGKFPVIDQGKEFIAGYSDDPRNLCRATTPVIVFGDHTKAWKYADFPFCLGADGTKILKPKAVLDAKFAYHFLRQTSFPDAGYSRHFKFLKDIRIPLPPLNEQRRIATILDQADTLRRIRRAALVGMGHLVGAIFDEIFGNSPSVSSKWPTAKFHDFLAEPLRNGVSPSSDGTVPESLLTLSAITSERFYEGAVKVGMFKTAPPPNQRVRLEDFLMCRGNGNIDLVGRGLFPLRDLPNTVFPDTIIAGRINTDKINRVFLEFIWNAPETRRQIQRMARTTNGTFKVNQTMLERVEIIDPPIHLQKTFAARVDAIWRHRAKGECQANRFDALFASLQKRAFRGEL